MGGGIEERDEESDKEEGCGKVRVHGFFQTDELEEEGGEDLEVKTKADA
jgi:hypothetical protein